MLSDRITDPTEVSASDVEKLITHYGHAVVQFSSAPYSTSLLVQLDVLCRRFGEALEVRFYGYYQGCFDASLLKHVPNVQNLSVDCLLRAERLEALYDLTMLKRLSLGIFELKDADILTRINVRHLRSFSIGETRSTKVDLSPLAQCPHLERAWIEAQPIGMVALAKLPNLTELTLRRIGKAHSIDFVSKIPLIKHLTVILGGRETIDEISHEGMETLNVIWVRGLNTIGDMGRFPSLREFTVQDQLQLRTMDISKASKFLRKLTIINCKNLAALGSLAEFESLEEVVVGGTCLDWEALVKTLPRSVHTVRFFEGTRKRDIEIRAKLNALGYKEFSTPKMRRADGLIR